MTFDRLDSTIGSRRGSALSLLSISSELNMDDRVMSDDRVIELNMEAMIEESENCAKVKKEELEYLQEIEKDVIKMIKPCD